MYLDKQKAKHHRYRIPEAAFFMIAILGGSLGVWIGMYMCHHKTKHLSFVLMVPLILIIQFILYILLWKG